MGVEYIIVLLEVTENLNPLLATNLTALRDLNDLLSKEPLQKRGMKQGAHSLLKQKIYNLHHTGIHRRGLQCQNQGLSSILLISAHPRVVQYFH